MTKPTLAERAKAANTRRAWIGVDLDGTLAHHDKWRGLDHIGDPVPAMMARVRAWLDAGLDVRIFTARVSDPFEAGQARAAVERWCVKHLGRALPVTCVKDMHMDVLWDDRAIAVVKNLGIAIGESAATVGGLTESDRRTIEDAADTLSCSSQEIRDAMALGCDPDAMADELLAILARIPAARGPIGGAP